jgi:hypothetical protein
LELLSILFFHENLCSEICAIYDKAAKKCDELFFKLRTRKRFFLFISVAQMLKKSEERSKPVYIRMVEYFKFYLFYHKILSFLRRMLVRRLLLIAFELREWMLCVNL